MGAIAIARPYLTSDQIRQTVEKCVVWDRGVILCTALAAYHRKLTTNDEPGALIECTSMRFGLFLQDVKLAKPPIPFRGRQGIFKFEFPEPQSAPVATAEAIA
jgi:hypothetical protein